jgi:heptosyltransferase-2
MPGSTASASSRRAPGALVVGVNWIGDAIMSMPALQAWRRAHPDLELTLLVKQGLAPLWSMHAAPDRVLTYRDGLGAALRAAAAVRAVAPARAYVLPHSFRSALVPFLAGVPERIGLPGHARDFMLTQVVAPRLGPGRLHQGFEYGDLLLSGPDATSLEPPALDIPAAARAAAQPWVAPLPRPLLGLLPGAARGPAKRWPLSHVRELAGRWRRERRRRRAVDGRP